MLSFLESGGGGLFATSCRDKRAPRVYSDTSPPPPPSAGRGTGRESGWGGCEVTRGRGREVHYGSKVKQWGFFVKGGSWLGLGMNRYVWCRFDVEWFEIVLLQLWYLRNCSNFSVCRSIRFFFTIKFLSFIQKSRTGQNYIIAIQCWDKFGIKGKWISWKLLKTNIFMKNK